MELPLETETKKKTPSTRPFLEEIEKRWIAFQLLCGLRDCHARGIHHGDIKAENVLVTSWNWIYLSDFAPFKPTYLPEDNPADFSYFFDTSGRRICYVAPERFLGAGEGRGETSITDEMDIFSLGCVIAELFLEGTPLFTLSQLFKYRTGEYDPATYLEKIEDPEIRHLVQHMINLDPSKRHSAEQYLNIWRRKAFPEYFYSFLHQYIGFITDPTSGQGSLIVPDERDLTSQADDRIDRIYHDFDKISFFLGFDQSDTNDGGQQQQEKRVTSKDGIIPVHLDIPNYQRQSSIVRRRPVSSDDGTLIFLSLIASSLRNTSRATARVRACDVFLAFGERITDEAKLDRCLPYLVSLLNDEAVVVQVAAVRTVTQLVGFFLQPSFAYSYHIKKNQNKSNSFSFMLFLSLPFLLKHIFLIPSPVKPDGTRRDRLPRKRTRLPRIHPPQTPPLRHLRTRPPPCNLRLLSFLPRRQCL